MIQGKTRGSQKATGDIFDRVVVINLNRRKDRWLQVRRSFLKARLKTYMRFSAIDGGDLDLARDIRIGRATLPSFAKPRQDHRDLSIGGIGCFLSHIAIWEALLESTDAQEVAVFEDDAMPSSVFCDLSTEDRQRMFKNLPTNAGLILLGCNVVEGASCAGPRPGILRVFYFNATHAYVIRRRAVELLLPLILPIRAHLDHEISNVLLFRPDVLSAYTFEKSWFDHNWQSRSDVDSPIEDKQADRRLASYVERGKRHLREKFCIRCS
jgi:GR25 family glycosyltransferase involved in LPS biosynthesis